MKIVSIKENHVFRRMYAKGKSATAPSLVLYARRNGRKENRLGLTVSTKVGKAVVRNKVRRRLREIYRLHQGELGRGWDLVAVARAKAPFVPYAVLERDFLRLADKLGVRQRIPQSPGISRETTPFAKGATANCPPDNSPKGRTNESAQ